MRTRLMGSTFVRYLLVGIANTAIGYGVILIMQFHFGMHPVLANSSGYVLGLVVSYLLNRQYTFRSSRAHKEGVPVFIAAASICYLINVVVLQFSIHVAGLPAAISQAFAVTTYAVLFYFASRYTVFIKRSD